MDTFCWYPLCKQRTETAHRTFVLCAVHFSIIFLGQYRRPEAVRLGTLERQTRPFFQRKRDLRQYRIIEQEWFASKFCVLTRHSFAVILDVLPWNFGSADGTRARNRSQSQDTKFPQSTAALIVRCCLILFYTLPQLMPSRKQTSGNVIKKLYFAAGWLAIPSVPWYIINV